MDRYEEAMSRCKQWEREHPKGYVIQDMIEFIFPELAESDDEKNWKAVLEYVKDDALRVWLEKQKEQKPADIPSSGSGAMGTTPPVYKLDVKPAEWSEEDEKMIDYAYGLCYNAHETAHSAQNANKATKCMSWLKSLRPQPKAELTLLDENIIKAAVAFVEQNDHFNCWCGIDKHTVIKALRSLKPHWKPSEEQVEMLSYVVEGRSDLCGDVLRSLYQDLKKLM